MSFKDGDVVAQIIGHGAERSILYKRVVFKATPTRVELRMCCTTAGAKPCGSGERYRQDNGNRTPPPDAFSYDSIKPWTADHDVAYRRQELIAWVQYAVAALQSRTSVASLDARSNTVLVQLKALLESTKELLE